MSFIYPKWIPAATDSSKGGVKVGSGLSVTEDGTLSVSGLASSAVSHGDSTVEAVLSALQASVWQPITGAATTANNVIEKIGISSDIEPLQLIRYYKGAAVPTTDSAWYYGIAPSTIGTDSLTLTFGEYIPQTGDNFYLQKNVDNSRLYLDMAPVPGLWAIATATDMLETYAAYRFYAPNLNMRLLGMYNCFSITNDSGATQPTINIAVNGTNFLSTAFTVTTAASPAFDSNTGLVTNGAAVTANTRITLPCVSTGTNKTSQDLQKYIALVILN